VQTANLTIQAKWYDHTMTQTINDHSQIG